MAAATAPNQDFAGVGKSASLTQSLERAHRIAVERAHGVVTLEHLLLSLTEDQDASAVFASSPVDLGRLRADLSGLLARVPPPDAVGRAILPNADLLRVLRLAATAAQQSQRTAIDGMIVLAAIIGDGKTAGAQLLTAHGLTFNEVIKVLQGAASPPRPQAAPVAAQPPQVPPPTVAPPRMVAPPQAMPVRQPPPPAPPPPSLPETPAIQVAESSPPIAAGDASVAVAAGSAARPRPQSTEDLLASVRARLQEAAPPLQRPPGSVPAGVSAASAAPVNVTPVRPPPIPVSAQPPAPPQPELPPVATTVAAPPALPPMPEASMSEPVPDMEPDEAVDSPDELPAETIAAPSRMPPKLNPAPLPLGRLEQARPEAVASPAELSPPDAVPPLASPPPVQRSGPPPLPPMAPPFEPATRAPEAPAMAPAQDGIGTLQPRPMQQGPAMAPGAAPAGPNLGFALPLPTVDLGALADTLPEQLVKGVVTIVEVAVPRRVFEIAQPMPQPRPGAWPPLRVATMRLFAQGDDVIVEPLSPPSSWLRIWRGPGDPDAVVWRWRVLPRRTGTVGLTLTFGVRTIGPDGVGQEALWPEETVGVRVRTGKGRRLVVGTLFVFALLAGAYGGLHYAGKADLVRKPVMDAVQAITGKR